MRTSIIDNQFTTPGLLTYVNGGGGAFSLFDPYLALNILLTRYLPGRQNVYSLFFSFPFGDKSFLNICRTFSTLYKKYFTST